MCSHFSILIYVMRNDFFSYSCFILSLLFITLVRNVCFSLQDLDLPKGFPFEIVDNPGDQSITLKREFAGEKIQVNVFMELDDMGDMNEDDEDDGNDDDDHEDGNSPMPKISLIALIDKGEGPSLEFCCDLAADGLHIENMLLKRDDSSSEEGNAYEGPEFS